MQTIKIVGAGQLGSRHLQALQAVQGPLNIYVIDPSPQSLQVAKERFEAVAGQSGHQVQFVQKIESTGPTDIAIVATGAKVRRDAVQQLLAASPVRYMVLEKLLFSQPGDYLGFAEHMAAAGTRAWVNCPMRMMPTYEAIRAELAGGPIDYRVSGSCFGLVTNAIHYIDHVAHLVGCRDFSLDVAGLDPQPIPSKRDGYLELNGRLQAHFADGSRCDITCHARGDAPVVVEIFSETRRFIVRESEGLLWASSAAEGWTWTQRSANIPYQSQLTTQVVASLLDKGDCNLSPIADSVAIHTAMLAPLLDTLRMGLPELNHYPFT